MKKTYFTPSKIRNSTCYHKSVLGEIKHHIFKTMKNLSLKYLKLIPQYIQLILYKFHVQGEI